MHLLHAMLRRFLFRLLGNPQGIAIQACGNGGVRLWCGEPATAGGPTLHIPGLRALRARWQTV